MGLRCCWMLRRPAHAEKRRWGCVRATCLLCSLLMVYEVEDAGSGERRFIKGDRLNNTSIVVIVRDSEQVIFLVLFTYG